MITEEDVLSGCSLWFVRGSDYSVHQVDEFIGFVERDYPKAALVSSTYNRGSKSYIPLRDVFTDESDAIRYALFLAERELDTLKRELKQYQKKFEMAQRGLSYATNSYERDSSVPISAIAVLRDALRPDAE